MSLERHSYIHTIHTILGLVLWIQLLPAQSTESSQFAEAAALRDKGEFAQALRILEPLAAASGPEFADAGKTWILLGVLYQDLSRYPEAQRAYQTAISLSKGKPGKEMEEAAAMDNLGSFYLDMGQPEMSKRLRLRVLQTVTTAGDHAGMARVSNNLAAIAIQQRNIKEARQWIGRAFAEVKLAPHLTAADLAAIHCNAGWLSMHDRDYAEAAEHYEVALRSWTECHGTNHPLTGWGYVLRGRTRALMGEPDQGLEDVTAGLAIIEKTLGTGVPFYFAARLAYADALSAAGASREAKTMRSITRRAIESFRQTTSSQYAVSADAFR